MFSIRTRNKERYSEGLWLIDPWYDEMNRLFQSGNVVRARMSVYFCTLSKHAKLYLKYCKTLYIISAIKE